MDDATAFIEETPLQDRDLLLRLSLYFDGFDTKLRRGQGWFIFNAPSGRSRRITSFIQQRLDDRQPPVAYSVMGWRDFALSAFVHEVGLPDLAPAARSADPRAREEFELATKITQSTVDELVQTDLLVLIGLKPSHRHEAMFLDRTIEGRYQQRLATILLTPDMPQELEAEFETLDPSRAYWQRLFQRMYETSLVAL